MNQIAQIQPQTPATMNFDGANENQPGDRLDMLDWATLFERGERFVLAHNTIVLRQGDEVGALYLLVDGEVRIEVGAAGQRAEVARLGPGAILGEMSLLSGAWASADVIAEGAVVVMRLERDCLASQVEADPAFGAAFYHSLAVLLARRVQATNLALAVK